MTKNGRIIYKKKHLNDLSDYDKVPMIASNNSIFKVKDKGFQGISLEEVPSKQYTHDPSFGEGPTNWKSMFNLDNWGFYIAYDASAPIGAITLAYQTEHCHMLKGRDDLVVIWDIRGHPDYQGQGIGASLVDIAYDWAKARNANTLKVETQHNNVAACKFYASQGYHLGTIDRYAYGGDANDETMLLWYKSVN